MSRRRRPLRDTLLAIVLELCFDLRERQTRRYRFLDEVLSRLVVLQPDLLTRVGIAIFVLAWTLQRVRTRADLSLSLYSTVQSDIFRPGGLVTKRDIFRNHTGFQRTVTGIDVTFCDRLNLRPLSRVTFCDRFCQLCVTFCDRLNLRP
jgi:hypothetical protein